MTHLFLCRALAGSKTVECRCACPAAFAAVTGIVTARRYATHVHETVLALAADADGRVRGCLAAELAALSTSLGRERALRYLRTPLLMLLTDTQVRYIQGRQSVRMRVPDR